MTTAKVRDLRVFAEALALLLAASVLIKILPFRLAAASSSYRLRRARNPDQAEVDLLVRAIRGWGRRVPWRAVCFQRGLALQWMLRRRGIDANLVYGIRHRDGLLAAHVWVELDRVAVLGGPEAEGFTEVTRFPSKRF